MSIKLSRPDAALSAWLPCRGSALVAGFLAFITAQMGLPILGRGDCYRLEGGDAQPSEDAWLGERGRADDGLAVLLALGQYYHNLDGTPYTPRSYVVWWD